jgi:glycosyltransferase involved in cell wall biosynthesis
MITSVLITLHNKEKYIDYALNSILRSNTKSIELIVSDNCSRDMSYSIAKNWINNHEQLFFSARLFQQSKNLGINENHNFLLREASGDFFTFLDADDALMPMAIDLNKQFLINNSKVDFLFSNQDLIDELNDTVKYKYVRSPREILIKIKFFIILDIIYNWGLPWSKIFARTESFKKLGCIPKTISYNDRWTGFKILQAGRYAYFNNISFQYRTRFDNSPTPSLTKKQLQDDLTLVELDALKYSKGALFILLFFYTLPLRIKSKNRLLTSLCKLPKKIIRILYRSII